MSDRRLSVLVLVVAGVLATPALAQFKPDAADIAAGIVPAYTIWDVKLGAPITDIPEMEVADIACGTNGGPPSMPLKSFADFGRCQPEPSGLREIYFANDDEMDYVSKALDSEYRVTQGGTSIYAHPIVQSALVDEQGIVRGIRIVTDDRAELRDRRLAVTLSKNLKARYKTWTQSCLDVPPATGENPVGKEFIHEVCAATSPDALQSLGIEATFLRKKGQEALSRETQKVNRGYFESRTRFELVEKPYDPSPAPTR